MRGLRLFTRLRGRFLPDYERQYIKNIAKIYRKNIYKNVIYYIIKSYNVETMWDEIKKERVKWRVKKKKKSGLCEWLREGQIKS